MQLLENLEFDNERPHAQALWVDRNGRVLRFTLGPGEGLMKHEVPDSPFYVVVLKGRGMFSGADEQEQEVGPNSLLIFDVGEWHSVRALDEEFVFVGFLHGVPSNKSNRVGGLMGRRGARRATSTARPRVGTGTGTAEQP